MALRIASLFVLGLSGGQEQTGILTGTARDTSGAAIPGVMITLSPPGERVAITDALGEYRSIEICPMPNVDAVGRRFRSKQ